jgi:NAD dependent epimerase/dehydratase family enzyme
VIPGFVLRLALGEFAEDVLGGQRVLPKVLQEHGYRFAHPTLRSALEAVLRDDQVGVGSDG